MPSPTTDGKPQLLALLICEKTLFDDGNPGVVRLEFTVFTRWSGGPGVYTEDLVLIDPNGDQQGPRNQSKVTLEGGFHFQQIRHEIRMDMLAVSGTYSWQVFLDGDRYAEHPFKVTVSRITPDEFKQRWERPTAPEQP